MVHKIHNTYKIWEGRSVLDDSPVALVATGINPSYKANKKTGEGVQTYILSSLYSFKDSIRNGSDVAVCGNCPLRRSKLGICYVNEKQGVRIISENLIKNTIPNISTEVYDYIKYMKLPLRFGAYGDPMAIPFQHFEKLIESTPYSYGYTHQWANKKIKDKDKYIKYLMASVHTKKAKRAANNMGWSTFRILKTGKKPLKDETLCSHELDLRVQCKDCRLCSGYLAPNIAVHIHGFNWIVNKFNSLKE